MDNFAENPLFLIMDDMTPIISVKASKDIRKIVELSDTGCDARLPACNDLRNAARRHSPKLLNAPSDERSKSYNKERFDNNPDEGRFRVKNKCNAMDMEERYSNSERDEIDRYYWEKHVPYEVTMGNIEFRRGPESNDIRAELRATPERARANNWRQENNPNEIFFNAVRNNRDATRRDIRNETDAFRSTPKNHHTFRSRPMNTEPRYAPSNGPRLDCRINSRRMYPEDRPSREMPRYSPRNHRESCNDTEIAQRNHRFARLGSTNGGRLASSAKSSDWVETTASRIRSRTCSPPVDRRQRAECAPKPTKFIHRPSYAPSEFDSEQLTDNVRTMLTGNDNLFSRDVGSRLYVDRAVDKDSLPDMRRTGGSDESLFGSIDKTASDVDKCNVRASFWEFIPFDDEEMGKRNESATAGSCNEQTAAAGTFNNRKNTFIDLSNEQHPATRVPTAKSRGKIPEKLVPDWNEKTNRYLKRPGSAKLEFNEDKKKKLTSIVERTAACLRRKSDKSEKTGSATLGQSSSTRTERKVCSKLPIRIGNRLRSRDPTKQKADAQEENKQAETRDSPRSIRSRTKPRIRPSVVLNEVIHNTETFANSHSVTGQSGNDANAKENSPTFESMGVEKLEDEEVEESKIPGTTKDHWKRSSASPNGGRERKISGIGFKKCFRLNNEKDVVCNSYCNREHRNLNSFQSKKPATIRSQF